MLFNTILVTFALAAAVAAQEVDNNDVPMECRAVCSSIVSVAQQCDNQHRDDDRAELNCICSASGINTQLPLCEACVAQFDRDDDNDRDNDINDLLRSCSLSTTNFNPSSAPTPSATVISGSPSLTTPTGGSAQTTGTGRPSQTSGPPQTSNGPTRSDAPPPAEQTGNNAVGKPTGGMVGVGLGLAMALL